MIFDAIGVILVSGRQCFVTVCHKSLQGIFFSAVVTTAIALGFHGTSVASNDYNLTTYVNSTRFQKIHAVVEVRGDLKLNADGQGVRRIPLRVSGDLHYDERNLWDNGVESQRWVRNYEQAHATIKIGETPIETKLRKERRLVLADVEGAQQTLISLQGPLTRDELELIDIQGSTALLDQLAPQKTVALSASWHHGDQLVAQLLGLDAISQSDVTSTLRQVEGDVAIIDMSGTVSGAVDGVASDIKLQAKYNINLQQHRVTWLAMSIRENRAVGHATPGFEVVARIRVAISKIPDVAELRDSALEHLSLAARPGASLLELASVAGGFRMLHPRDWQVMIDRHDVTVLRQIDHGELIAQCNLSSLPNLPPGERAALKGFQGDIQRALGSNFGQFVETSQSTNDQGLRILRAVVAGVSSELPVQWIYYHLSDTSGRQAAIVFTMDAKAVEKFAGADLGLVSSFAFLQRNRGVPTAADHLDSAEKPVVEVPQRR